MFNLLDFRQRVLSIRPSLPTKNKWPFCTTSVFQLHTSSCSYFFCFLTLVNFKMSQYIPFSVPPGDSPGLIVVLSINNNLYMSCRMEDNKVVLFLEVNINSHDAIPFYFFLESIKQTNSPCLQPPVLPCPIIFI